MAKLSPTFTKPTGAQQYLDFKRPHPQNFIKPILRYIECAPLSLIKTEKNSPRRIVLNPFSEGTPKYTNRLAEKYH